MLRYLLVCALIPFMANGQLEQLVSRCHLNYPLPITLSINDCTELPCEIPANGNIDIEANFNTYLEAEYFGPSIFGLIEGDEERHYIEIPEEQQYGCNFLGEGQSCPLEAFANYDYKVSLPFEADPIPTGTELSAQFTLYDDNESSIICFVLPIVIV